MVSNSLNMDLQDFVRSLQRIKTEHGNSREFKDWRKLIPKDWPV